MSDTEISSKAGAHWSDLAGLLVTEKQLVPAQKDSPGEWKRWWWVCIAGQFVFLLLIVTMRGRWSPRAARRDFEEHERLVDEELSKMGGSPSVSGAPEITAKAPA